MRLIDFKELKPKKGINYTRDHLRRKCKAGEFPQPVAISTARIAWVEAEIDKWLADKAWARDQDRAPRCEALPVSDMAAPEFVGEPTAQRRSLRAGATEAELTDPPLGRGPARARDTKLSVLRRAE